MGYQTDYIGYLHVQPALNDTEIDFINRVAHLGLKGEGLTSVDSAEAARRTLMAEAPRGWTNWGACAEGCCLAYDGGDKANHMIGWFRFLVPTFLTPGAVAQGRPGFEEFTADHMANGMVVGSRRDNRQLFGITVVENVISTELMWPGVSEWSSYPPLRYQDEIDEFREWAAAYRLREAKAKARDSWEGSGFPEW